MDWASVGFALVMVMLGAYVAACRGGPEAGSDSSADAALGPTSELPDRDPALAKRLVEEEDALLLDVRTSLEWKMGHIEGAMLIPVQDLKGRLDEVETATDGDKDKPIVVYCRSGSRSANAKKILEAAGYTKVTNVGGMSDYPRD